MKMVLLFFLASCFVFASGDVGFVLRGEYSVSEYLDIINTRYYGECPSFSKGAIKVSFMSEHTLPRRNYRVVILNNSAGINTRSQPDVHVEYSSGDSSEVFYLREDDSYRREFLGVLRGLNSFFYYIYDVNTSKIVEEGIYKTFVKIRERYVLKNKERFWKYICYPDTPYPYSPTPFPVPCRWTYVSECR